MSKVREQTTTTTYRKRYRLYLTFHEVPEAIDQQSRGCFAPADDHDTLVEIRISSEFDRLMVGLLAGCVGAVD